MGWLQRLSDGLTKTRDVVRGSLDRLLGRAADPALLEEFEAALIASDLGARVVDRVIERLKKQLQGTDASQPDRVHTVLRDTLLDVLTPVQGLSLESLLAKGPKPFVILAVGVNGVGKTTTIAKIAQRLVQAGKVPLLVACDTFRAAAIDQPGSLHSTFYFLLSLEAFHHYEPTQAQRRRSEAERIHGQSPGGYGRGHKYEPCSYR